MFVYNSMKILERRGGEVNTWTDRGHLGSMFEAQTESEPLIKLMNKCSISNKCPIYSPLLQIKAAQRKKKPLNFQSHLNHFRGQSVNFDQIMIS